MTAYLVVFRISLILTVLGCFAQAGLLQDAQKDLFAARYKQAAAAYSKTLAEGTADPDAYYGLVRALIEDHRSHEAYRVAEEGLEKNPHTPGVETAAGLAAYRRGDLVNAEEHFRAALKLDSNYAGALHGLGAINNLVSRFKSAREYILSAYRSAPTDPQLMAARANTLKGPEHVAALQEALALLDPDSDDAHRLSAHLANDLAAGGRKLRRLLSPYEKTTIKLSTVFGPSAPRGAAIPVRLNGKHKLLLMLDTGASGISISPKAAAAAGLEMLGEKSTEAKGVGDRAAQPSYSYIAKEIRMSDVVIADYPVSVFRAAKSSDFDGLLGADVFKSFIVTLDFPKMEMYLEPRSAGPGSDTDEPVDATSPPPAGFHRALRFGNHLAVPTLINNGKSSLFLVDSGSSANLLDTEIGRQSTFMRPDDRTVVGGIQGNVNQISRTNRVTLVFAGFRQESSSLIAISLEHTCDEFGVALGGILGWPVLSQLSLTIDYQQGIVHFEHRK